jgi:membrane protein YqaA with SNARE-associated domain
MTAGTLGLLAFAGAILAGLWAENNMTNILLRAWWALVLFAVLGAVIGWMAQISINEHLEDRKNEKQQQADQDDQAGQQGSSNTQENT